MSRRFLNLQTRLARRWLATLMLSALAMATGCGPGGSVVKTCVLPSDQSATLEGKWQLTPIPIALQAGVFSASEISAIQAAVRSWNQFATQVYGFALFDFQEGNSPRTSGIPRSSYSCNSVVTSSGYTAPIVIYRLTAGQWPGNAGSESTSSTSGNTSMPEIASTQQCLNKSTKTYVSSAIDLNFSDYFVSGKPMPDLQSIVTHELGHLVGLEHSCTLSSAQAGVPSCSGNVSPTYLKASLYPSFNYNSGTGTFESRRALNSNDQGRTNCLYGS